ncbi:hypothetical protein [Croceicoccus gelatinilyticus]|uniref:hypothetical protein n=1 Tax=Croceicoccus gelatinilyticus TaxID=2835536 RepID=UPI001BCECF0E|nr:hypothetical protein [Croceicoccus gelatinilyticus]MBS7669127.1 hypothetical protein [Croceicoccus gelatinilyticus]
MNAQTWPLEQVRARMAMPVSTVPWQARRSLTLPVLALTSALLCLLLWLQDAGYVSQASLELWGQALLASDGAVAAPSIIAASPPLPYFATIVGELAMPSFGMRILPLVTALFFALMVAGWLRTFQSAGLSWGVSIGAAVLLASNPALVRSIAESPCWASLHAGLSMLAVGLFNLRRDHRITDVILVALSLPLILMSQPVGLVFVVAAVPFIALCVPEAQMRRSVTGVMMTLLFPATFVLGGFAYVNWIFNGDAFAFLGHFADIPITPPLPLAALLLALAGMVASAPILPAIVVRTRRQVGVRRASLAIGGFALACAGLCWLTQTMPEPVQLAALAVPLAMAAATRWPRNRVRSEMLVIGMLMLGWAGGAVIVWQARDVESANLRAVLTGRPTVAVDAELAALGLALQGHDDILFDAAAAPSAIAHRGSAEGISAASSIRFRLAGMRQDARAHIQVVRDTRSPRGADAMGRTFPDLHERGLPGYRILHEGPHWRAWIREDQP